MNLPSHVCVKSFVTAVKAAGKVTHLTIPSHKEFIYLRIKKNLCPGKALFVIATPSSLIIAPGRKYLNVH